MKNGFFTKKLLPTICFFSVVSIASAQDRAREVNCSGCSIEAGAAEFPIADFNNPLYELPQCSFPPTCNGNITVTDLPGVSYQADASLIDGEPSACPLSVLINNQLKNTLRTSNGSIHYSGNSLAKLSLIAANGNVTAENGAESLLNIDVSNGNALLKNVGGTLSVVARNGTITLQRCYGYNLNTYSVNNKTIAKSLTLYSKRTARMKAENAGINITTLRARVLKNDVYRPVKVIIKASAKNGAFIDRRPAGEKRLTPSERSKAAILRLTSMNGDIVVR